MIKINLRKKTLIIITFTLIALTIAMYIFTELTFKEDFSRIEKNTVTRDVTRAVNALNKEFSNLSSMSADWANWDDTYNFIQGTDTEYIEKNLTDESFINLNLNFMIFINNRNEIVFSKGFNLENNTEESIPLYITNYFLSSTSVGKYSSANSNVTGILTISNTNLVVSLSPITTSLKQGPIKGTLIMGKFMDNKFISQLSETTELSIDFSPLDPANFPLNSKEDVVIKPINDDTILGYTPIKDLYGNPTFILNVNSSREIYKEAVASEFHFTLFLFGSCLTFCIVSLKLLDMIVLNPSIEQEVLLNTIPALVYYKDKSLKYITGNTLFSKIFNVRKEEIRGKTDFDFFPDGQAEIIREQDFNILSSGTPKLNIERQITLPDGNNIWASTSKAPYVGNDGKIKGMVGITMNITDYKLSQDKIHYLAFYDPLTNLPNRTLFSLLVTKTILNSNEDNRLIALLYMDLDKFKLINDTLGHSAGDRFLQIVANKVLECICKSDILARLGGDEFGVLVKANNKNDIAILCTKIIDAVKEPWYVNNYEINAGVSIGIVLYPEDGEDISTLLKCADIAMYKAKAQGKNHYEFYNSTLSTKAEEELSMESRLLNALRNEEFELYYQPQFNALNRKLIGVEALIRWNHPELGMIPPSKFIPFAEERDLIISLGEWVLKTACTQAKLWQEKGLQPIPVSINLSSKQFQQKNLISTISSILEDTGLSSEYLQIEVTESMAMENPEYTLKVLNMLKNMGIKIALDDFGTGYSSLSYLKRFPIDKLKIDKFFIQNTDISSEDSEIVKIIILLAHKLNISTIAEGVETEEQLMFLKEEHCDEIQGFLSGKPMPSTLFEELLRGQTL